MPCCRAKGCVDCPKRTGHNKLCLVAVGLRFGMMNGAGGIGAHLVDSANLAPFGNDGVRGELAHFEPPAMATR
jgi:hypothetical protein